jgi:GTPase Era involved in 16S rRNA processing
MVVDTPGFFDTDTSVTNAMVERTITSQIFNMTSPGVHAFLIVLRTDRFTPEEKQTIEFIKTIFGAGAARYCILIFTREDQLDEGQTLEQFIRSSKDLQELVSICGNRKMAINNKLNGDLLDRKTKELVQIIEEMVRMNNGTYYTNAEYQRIEAQRRAEQQKREQEERDRKQRYEDQLKENVCLLVLIEVSHPNLCPFISGSSRRTNKGSKRSGSGADQTRRRRCSTRSN